MWCENIDLFLDVTWNITANFFNHMKKIYALLTVHPNIIFVNKPTWHTNFLCIFIYIPYMFQATTCPP